MKLSSSKPVHFLMVEDDQSHADLIMMALEDNNISNSVDHVLDGQEALAYLHKEGQYADAPTPDVVLLDVNLPKISGHEVLKHIKSDKQLLQIPVVMLTTSAAEQDRVKAYDHHVNSFLTKPVDFGKFQALVRALNMYWTVWNAPPVFKEAMV